MRLCQEIMDIKKGGELISPPELSKFMMAITTSQIYQAKLLP
jgi:hypothetical protein